MKNPSASIAQKNTPLRQQRSMWNGAFQRFGQRAPRVAQVENHNSGQWLRVEQQNGRYHYLASDGYERSLGSDRNSGWFVIRTCPCHAGNRITRRYDTEAEAWSALSQLLAASEMCGT